MSKDLTDALRDLMEQNVANVVEAPKERGAAPAVRAAALVPSAPAAASSGGAGIASPLTETTYASRTFHSSFVLSSPDGFLNLMIHPVDTINFTDANGESVAIKFKAPT